MSKEQRICEYFLITGFGKTRKPYDLSQIFYQGEELVNANVELTEEFFHYKEPITDIKIVNFNQKERVPDEFHLVDKTYSKQNKADLNGKSSVEELYLCFRYGRNKPPITDIWAFSPKQKNEICQNNWTLIDKTVNGHSANLHGSSSNALYLAFRRAPMNAPVDNLAVTDICVIFTNKNELCPPAYTRVDVPIKRSPLSHTINICYKKSMVKQHILTYQPETIYCLPCTSKEPVVDVYSTDSDQQNSSKHLPEDLCAVANFCMPWGATLESWPVSLKIPKPNFLTFVLTNVNYCRMYGAAVIFYEEYDPESITDEEADNLGINKSLYDPKNRGVFSSKSICLLSRWPLFQTFNQVLSFLIQEDERQRKGQPLDSVPCELPLERFISQLLHSVPFPTPEAPNILLQWDLENSIGIQLPTDALSRFGTGENFYNLVRMLDIEQIIQLFVYMLTEQKILLTSIYNSDLTGIAEALISMIFPFKWSVVYIPFLYLSCIHIIQSPSPYLIGVDSRFFDYFRLPDGVGCVDLVTKSIKPPDFNCRYLDYVKVLPKQVLKSLRIGLTNCKNKVSNFEKQQALRKSHGNTLDEFTILRKRESIGESIRECFLRAVILLFKNYQDFLIPVAFPRRHDEMFSVDDFLKSVDKSTRPLYHAIFETQLWGNFIRDRSFTTEFDDSLAFFDRCIKSLKDMDDETANATQLLQTDSIIQSEHTKVLPPPDPIDGWVPKTGRCTFPNTFNSELMLTTIHSDLQIVKNENADHNTNLSIAPGLLTESQVQNGSTSNLNVSDSSIPMLMILPQHGTSETNKNRRTLSASILKRPFEEQKQARQIAKDAKNNQSYIWASHLVTSAYCLWYINLPGLIGHILDTSGLCETGLADRIIQLAVEMFGTIKDFNLSLPDEVCCRVLIILIHQLRPAGLQVSDMFAYRMNAFSYGLCNQIVLEEKEAQSKETVKNLSEIGKHEQSYSEVSALLISNKGDSKDEKDCDSGRETLASANLPPEETPDVIDSKETTITKVEIAPMSDNEKNGVIEIGGKSVHLRGRHQGPRKRKERVSQLLFHSPMELFASDIDKNHQFFDKTAGIIMTSTPRTNKSDNLLSLTNNHRSPKSNTDSIKETVHELQDVQTDSIKPAIFTKNPFAEERSELHYSFFTNKPSTDSVYAPKEITLTEKMDGVITSLKACERGQQTTVQLNPLRTSDSRLTQSDFGSGNIANKTRASFRQIKNAANKSFRSVRSMMSTVSSGIWLTPGDSSTNSLQTSGSDVRQKGHSGLPAAFRPWTLQNNNSGNKGSQDTKLKTTASADLLDTIGDRPEAVQINRPCAGTVQQLRRQHNFNIQWPNNSSMESFHSENSQSTISLDTDIYPAVTLDNIWEKITDSLAAVRLPTGKLWSKDAAEIYTFIECAQVLHVNMTSCSECSQCHYSIYDDDIINNWSWDDNDLQSSCPYCDTKFSPKLSFQVYITPCDSQHETFKYPTARSILAYKSNLNYLSPFVLRKEIESVLQQEGEIALLLPNFIAKHDILFWNLVWFFSRLNLPTHLLSFIPKWLHKKGEALSKTNDENRIKYQILLDLSGLEQVFVSIFWEFNQLSGKGGLPLYRRYHNSKRTLGIESIVGSTYSQTDNLVSTILTLLRQNDVYTAILTLIQARQTAPIEGNQLNQLSPLVGDRSIYRELFFLTMAALERFHVDYDAFHCIYMESIIKINKLYPHLVRRVDQPPTDATLFCRRVFRQLQL